jgi:hypothetical protein
MTSPASWSDDPVLAKVKRALIESNGIRAFADAAALFRKFDTNKNGWIEEAEFKAGIEACGVKLSAQELRYLILAFDDNRDGRISLHEWVGELVYPQMNLRRQRSVINGFNDLSAKAAAAGLPGVTPAFVRQRFDVSKHPEVRSGRVPAHIIDREMAQAFGDDIAGNEAGDNEAISLDTFKALLAGLSSVVPSDDIFDEMIVCCFGIDNSRRPAFASTQRDWSQTTLGQDPLEYEPKRPDDAYSKALQSMTLANRRGYDTSATARPQPDREPKLNKSCPRTWETSSRVDFQNPAHVVVKKRF